MIIFMSFIALLSVAYVILQPLIWRILFPGEGLPQPSNDLTALIAPTATVIAIALGAFGVLCYGVVRERLEKRVDDKVSEANRKLDEAMKDLYAKMESALEAAAKPIKDGFDERAQQATSSALGEIRRMLSEVRAVADESLARQYGHNSIADWRRYEETIWRPHWDHTPCGHDVENNQEFVRATQAALDYARRQLEVANRLPDDANAKNTLVIAAKNCIAYHLGTRRKEAERKEALELASELEGSSDQRRVETAIWVYLRYGSVASGTFGRNLVSKGHALLRTWLMDQGLEVPLRQDIRRKYGALFPALELPPLQ